MYKDVQQVSKDQFKLSDIGWFPILRPSLSMSFSDIQTEFGNISAKAYPALIVEIREDCMLGLVISTAGGHGLGRKPESIRNRSTYVIGKRFRSFTSPTYGASLLPRISLNVTIGDYDPREGAFVDMFDTCKIPYDSRFEKKGAFTRESLTDLTIMRISVALHSKIAAPDDVQKFKRWLDAWEKIFVVSGKPATEPLSTVKNQAVNSKPAPT
jgi:hypothetical protein